VDRGADGKKRITFHAAYAHLRDQRFSLEIFEELWSPNPGAQGLALWTNEIVEVEADGPQGEAKLLSLGLPRTATFRSKRGPKFLYRKPSELPPFEKNPWPQVEVLHGKALIVPPTKGYEWWPGQSLDDVEPSLLPSTVLAAPRAPLVGEPVKLTPASQMDPGTAHDGMVRVVGKLAREAESLDALWPEALAMNADRLPEPELRRMVGDIWRREAAKRAREIPVSSGPETSRRPRRVGVKPATNVDISKRQEWTWREGDEHKDPRRAFVILAGMGDVGKTAVLCDKLARLTRGLLPGDLELQPVRVLYIVKGEVGEEKAAKLLHAAGADMGLVDFEQVESGDEEVLLRVPEDVPRVEELVAEREYGAIAFDNIEAHVEELANAYAENSIRNRVVTPLMNLAQRQNITVYAIKHPPKAEYQHAHHMVAGSSAWINASRACFFIRTDPDKDGVKLMIHVKGNDAPRYATTVEYQLEPAPSNDEVPVVRWGELRPDVTHVNFARESYAPQDVEEEIVWALKGVTSLSPQGIREVLGTVMERVPSEDALRKRLQRMAKDGLLARAGSSGGGPSEYTLPSYARESNRRRSPLDPLDELVGL
jgi:hypothetical protein